MTAVHDDTVGRDALPASHPRGEDLDTALWNSAVTADAFTDEAVYRYHMAVMEQYRVYVESADRVSARRNTANAFFLSGNTALLTLLGAATTVETHRIPVAVIVCVLAAALCQCLIWGIQARSYRVLSSAKWAVVAELERRLPALAYSSAEWVTALPSRRYRPLTRIERWIPALFAALHLGMGIAVLLSG